MKSEWDWEGAGCVRILVCMEATENEWRIESYGMEGNGAGGSERKNASMDRVCLAVCIRLRKALPFCVVSTGVVFYI